MKEWFAASELAKAALPSLPATERGVQKLTERQAWNSRNRDGRGGGREYHISNLPPAARAELARRAAISEAKAGKSHAKALNGDLRAAAVDKLVAAGRIAPDARVKADARAEIVGLWRQYHEAAGGRVIDTQDAFCALYNAGELDLDDAVTGLIPALSRSSLNRWYATVRKKGLAGLVDQYGNRKGSGQIDRDAEIKAFVVGMLTEHPHCSSAHVIAGIRARFNGRRIPSYRTVQRFMKAWKIENANVHAAVTNPDKWKSKYRAAAGTASEDVERLNQLWEMDSTPADIVLSDGGRHALVGVIDVYTRRLKLLVSRTSTADAVTSLLRRALLDWGVPEAVKTDNGADYVSKKVRQVLEGLDVRQDLCQPFTPEAKPFIERAFKTFSHDILELLPGFVGHNVAERQDIEARKAFSQRLGNKEPIAVGMTADELQDFCDQWCEAVYAHNPHRGLGGSSPFQATAAWTGAVMRIENERALDILLSVAPGDQSLRMVTKKGVRLDHGYFDAARLAEHVGQQIRVHYDDGDIGRIFVFALDGEFICEAICPERLGISRQELAAAKRAHQKKHMREQRAELRATAKGANTADIAQEIVSDRVSRAQALVPLPSPTYPHETPQLSAAADAAAEPLFQPRELTPAERQAQLRVASDLAKPAAPERPQRQVNFERALALIAAEEVGEAIDETDAQWLRLYRQSGEFRSQYELYRDFKLGGTATQQTA